MVLNELSSIEDDPAQKVIQELRRRHFPAPWGRPSQGREESVEAIKLKQVKQHVARNYRPNGTIVSVAGRFDWKAVQDHVAKLYSDWASQPAKEPPLGKPGKRLEHLEQESNQTQIGIAYPSVPYRDPDYFQAWGAVGRAERRHELAGCSPRYARNAGCATACTLRTISLRDRGGGMCYAGTSAERAQETLDVTLGELRTAGHGGRSRTN